MKIVRFHEAARNELHEAVDYYEQIYHGLGIDFSQEVKYSIKLVQQFPDICSPYTDGTMRILTRRFPYQIVFLHHQDILWIIAVAHQKRFPEYWQNRLNQ